MHPVQSGDDDKRVDAGAQSISQPLQDGSGSDALTVEIVEEAWEVGKRTVQEATVRVSTETHSITEIAEIVLDHTIVDVERVPINRIVDTIPNIRTEGDVTIMPVVEERLVLVKQLVLTEEVHIRSRTQGETIRQPVELRRQTVKVERLKTDASD